MVKSSGAEGRLFVLSNENKVLLRSTFFILREQSKGAFWKEVAVGVDFFEFVFI